MLAILHNFDINTKDICRQLWTPADSSLLKMGIQFIDKIDIFEKKNEKMTFSIIYYSVLSYFLYLSEKALSNFHTATFRTWSSGLIIDLYLKLKSVWLDCKYIETFKFFKIVDYRMIMRADEQAFRLYYNSFSSSLLCT